MANINQRLTKLEEQAAAKRSGVLVFYKQDDGAYIDASQHVFDHSASGIDAPSFVKRYTQAEVDELGRMHQLIVVEYASNWRELATGTI